MINQNKVNQLKEEIKMDIEDFIELEMFTNDYTYEILTEKENKGKLTKEEKCNLLYKRRVNNQKNFKVIDLNKSLDIESLRNEKSLLVLLNSNLNILPLFPIQLSGKTEKEKNGESHFIERMIERLPKINRKTNKNYTYKTILENIYNGILDFEFKIDFFNKEIFKVFLNFVDKDENILFIIPMSICFDKKFCQEDNIYRYGTVFNEKRMINIINYLGYKKFQRMLMNKTSRLYRRFDLKDTIFDKERFNLFKYCYQKENNFEFVDNINVQEKSKFLKRLKTFFSGTYKLTTFLSLDENSEWFNRKKYKINKSNEYEYTLTITERNYWRVEDIYKMWLSDFIDEIMKKGNKTILNENKMKGNIFKEIDGEKYNISIIDNGFWKVKIYWKNNKNEDEVIVEDINLINIDTNVYIFDVKIN